MFEPTNHSHYDDYDPKAPRTPWGRAQEIITYNNKEGIRFISTAGHGGIKLDRKTNPKVHASWRRKGGWYEEDCEWAIVALTFPEMFTEEEIESAHTICKNYFPDEYTTATGNPVSVADSYVLQRRIREKRQLTEFVSGAVWGDCFEFVPKGHVLVCGKKGPPENMVEEFFLVPQEEYKPNEMVLTGYPITKIRP